MNCCKCNEPIVEPKKAWPEIAGFARPRAERGDNSGSSLVGRQPTGRVMCSACAVDLVHGVPQGQESLL